MKPEFAAALKKCMTFSSKSSDYPNLNIAEKGKSAFLLKGSAAYKRKRGEMEEVKNEEKMLEKDKH